MIYTKLQELELQISDLSLEEKKWLLKQLSDKISEQSNQEIEKMASDPEIQAEIRAINDEFISTEMDGLDEYEY